MIIEKKILQILEDYFSPSHLEVLNESSMHNVAPGAESHFRVIIVSELFIDKRLLTQHQLVNQALRALLKESIHALAIVTRTPKQWKESQKSGRSPQCLG